MKLTKKQLKAVEGLCTDLNELENKPRRLYYALEEFAFAFDEEDAIPSIRDAQDSMYEYFNQGDWYKELFDSLREFKVKKWRNQTKNFPDNLETTQDEICGAEDFIKEYIRRLNED